MPQTIQEWADFDYIGSSGPWVSDERYALVERFKFYNQLAYRKNGTLMKPLQAMARWRMRNWKFGMPWEKTLVEWVRPKAKLS